MGLACVWGERAANDQSQGNAFRSLETRLAPLCSLPTGAQRCRICCADCSQWFSHPAFLCFITYTISRAALRTGLKLPGWLSPPHHPAQGMQDHIAFLCYQPPAFPAPCNLCTVLQTLPSPSQLLAAHTVLCVVTQRLSINTPSVKKDAYKAILSPWHPITVFHDSAHRHLCKAHEASRKEGVKHAEVQTRNPYAMYMSASLSFFMHDIKSSIAEASHG